MLTRCCSMCIRMAKVTSKKQLHIVYLVMRIADVSGGTRVIVEHVNRLHDSGHRVELWVANAGDKPYFDCRVPVRVADDDQLSMPDIVVMTDPGLLPMVNAHRHTGKTYLLVQHDNEWVSEIMNATTAAGLLGAYRDYFLNGTYSLLTVSSWVQEVMESRYGIKSVLIPNGVDLEVFRPTTPLISSADPSVLFIYDPQAWKGAYEVTQAALEIKNKVSNLRLIMIGVYFPETPGEAGMYYGFPYPVTYFCRPTQADLASIYTSATVFVSASWREGFGLPGLEAMACGVPLVTTDSGGVRDYALPGETAIVVQPNSVPALVSGILRVLENPGLAAKLSKNGLSKAAEFKWDKSISMLEEIFKSGILKNR
jgi:glycosyltransferase involved in cell wall biosynthesis